MMVFKSRMEEILYCKKNNIDYDKFLYSTGEKMLNELSLGGQSITKKVVFTGIANINNTKYNFLENIEDNILLNINISHSSSSSIYNRDFLIVKKNTYFYLFTNSSNYLEILFDNDSFTITYIYGKITINKIEIIGGV